MKIPELRIEKVCAGPEGRLSDQARGTILAHLRRYPGVPLDVLIRQHRSRRSEKANAYYWSTVLRILEEQSESGTSDVELHDAFCEMFLPTQAKQVAFFSKLTGESLSIATDGRRSSALSGGPFYDFVERVREFGRTFWGIDTPAPDPDYWRRRDDATPEGAADGTRDVSR